MKQLIALHTNPPYLARFLSIRDSKHLITREALLQVHQPLESQFAAYDLAARSKTLHALVANADCASKAGALRSCYESTTKALEKLKADIWEMQPQRLLKYCPMCGITLPLTFDHYLPMAAFPEFAVFPLNLVPCCSSCNSIKDDDWLSASGARQFLHAVLDDIPEVEFITVSFHEGANGAVGVTFDVTRPPGLNDGAWALIASHVTKLRLVERYNKFGSDEVAEIIANCRIYIEQGGADVRRFLLACAGDRRQAHGRSHWRAVLMNAMALHDRLLSWISEGYPGTTEGAT